MAGGATINLVGHSQGSLIVQSAMRNLSGFDFEGRLHVEAFGPAANQGSFTIAAHNAGASVGRFLVNQRDLVATIVGRNATSFMSVLQSIAASPRLFGSCQGSPHSSCSYFPGK